MGNNIKQDSPENYRAEDHYAELFADLQKMRRTLKALSQPARVHPTTHHQELIALIRVREQLAKDAVDG